jgi:hypothetical protein
MLVGLKENVILGHLIPAGTAFQPHLNLKVKHLAQPPALPEPEPTAIPAGAGGRLGREDITATGTTTGLREAVPQAGS